MHHENEWIQATVVNKHHTPRSYIVRKPNGKFYRRNRRHIRMRVSQAKNKETDATRKQASHTKVVHRSET